MALSFLLAFLIMVSTAVGALDTIYQVDNPGSPTCENAYLEEGNAQVISQGGCFSAQSVDQLNLTLTNKLHTIEFTLLPRKSENDVDFVKYWIVNCTLFVGVLNAGDCPSTNVSLTNNDGPWCQQTAEEHSILFGCQSQFLPTSAPTGRPSVHPTTSEPSRSPSSRPSKSPSRRPSTQRPTQSPSGNPTTQRPTQNPSRSPTTSTPTRNPTFQPTTLRPTFNTKNCKPSGRMTKQRCRALVSKCETVESKLKWTGKGCRSPKGAILGDGGCQCDGYCGYHCKKACSSDRQCHWVNNTCQVRATGLPGVPITQCR